MKGLEGGTVLPITGFWTGRASAGHTSEQPCRPVSQVDIDATNTIQRTGWRVNREILDIAREAYLKGHPSIGVNPFVPPSRAPWIAPDVFKTLPLDVRKAAITARRASERASQVWRSDTSAITALIEAAHRDRDWPSLYITWSHDSRLRRYPRITQGPSPQGSDLSRSMLNFDTGMPLGERGWWWLCVRAGTMAGFDKINHEDRVKWTEDNLEGIIESARDPLGVDFWHRHDDGKPRDEPWGFLATCLEITLALDSGDPEGFYSHLPVSVDGTCNGLQHLSAQGLDPVGAFATNLTPCSDRQDIYQEVAAACERMVTQDAQVGVPWAAQWVGKVTRAVVKRGTMTTVYGVTERGMRDQLIEDGFVDHHEQSDKIASAGYLRDVMWKAIGEVAVSARSIMDWLQETTVALAKENIPMRWRTPTGSVVQQSYRPWVVIRPDTAFGRVLLAASFDKSRLNARKCALASAPNWTHSFDAAHMALTINSGALEGITHWSMIHDSFGTHACHMDTLSTVLRREFVRIYQTDWLDDFYKFTGEYAPNVVLPPPPPRGSLDIFKVLDSLWFFA